jgi:hypothetical protein
MKLARPDHWGSSHVLEHPDRHIADFAKKHLQVEWQGWLAEAFEQHLTLFPATGLPPLAAWW